MHYPAIDRPLPVRLSLESGLHLPTTSFSAGSRCQWFTSGRVSEPRLSSSPPFSSPGLPYPFPVCSRPLAQRRGLDIDCLAVWTLPISFSLVCYVRTHVCSNSLAWPGSFVVSGGPSETHLCMPAELKTATNIGLVNRPRLSALVTPYCMRLRLLITTSSRPTQFSVAHEFFIATDDQR